MVIGKDLVVSGKREGCKETDGSPAAVPLIGLEANTETTGRHAQGNSRCLLCSAEDRDEAIGGVVAQGLDGVW